ncbi:hypothetical protein [Streptomyces sp. NPDC096934]|uniref:hypothetical protein n=1 Tax=Streptomyces sp. NPDC096934 TaxID=3155551 RepID=UPI00331B3920
MRQHFAQPGVTVTESKMLIDAVRNIEREVDVVIEGEFDGEPMIISVEVIEHSRPATVTWVDGMLRKHRDLPTNRLLLVSKSGFTSTALAAIDREAGRVQALTPEVVLDEGQAVVKRLFVDAFSFTPTGCNMQVRAAEEELILVSGAPLIDIYDADRNILGPLSYLVREATNLDAVKAWLSIELHKTPEKGQVKGFSMGLPITPLGYHVQRPDTGHLKLIEELIIWGEFVASQTDVPLTLTRLGRLTFGAAEASVAGRDAVWVGTTDLEAQSTTISWQITDPPSLRQRPATVERPACFPALQDLFPVPAT